MQGWKTFVFNGAMGFVAILAELMSYLTDLDWKQLVPPESAPYVVLSIGVANILLRHMTSGPAGWVGNAEGSASSDPRS
ncbi:hypothetical protein [Roseibium limicola]|uniref:Holin n=1 Tax=Roseibium limicola TaxID=2816037 RepID=A0A939J6J2_9HYPH|nr:hypothetical protein [Roseibium limicola]MBO0345187.1 hypothetical protein [Roseibium limicola]